MTLEISPVSKVGLSGQIAEAIRDAIVSGQITVGERLPSETELAERFGVSRPTVREALKRLAAQRLIRTQRGATGGAFVNQITWDEAYDDLITTSTLLISMNEVDFVAAAEARFTLERACIPLACQRRTEAHLACMRQELGRQDDPELTDEQFCASDVAFHRALVDAAGNPILSFQLAGAVEAIEPLMNMITYTRRDRARVVSLHQRISTAVDDRATGKAEAALDELSDYTLTLARQVRQARAAHR
ncbi:MAG: FadR/GntR family transcriptional regulator [Pseudomonadota bacterium]